MKEKNNLEFEEVSGKTDDDGSVPNQTGKTKEEVLAMSDTELEEFLKDHTVSAVFGTMVYLQAADAHNRLDQLK